LLPSVLVDTIFVSSGDDSRTEEPRLEFAPSPLDLVMTSSSDILSSSYLSL
jgi:hypothetical protein